ncbi:MAG: hypothetical protein COW13_00495, partial [Candidatus Omnitrophica bacterium CG12_big_fil_rev_8_21_14_0_65_50_5]
MNNYNILCVDDDPEFLVCLRLELEKFYHCLTTNTLSEGLKIIRNETIDLVLLDITLSDGDGIDGLRNIKKIDPSIDVVMVSGHKDPKFVISSIRDGASDYICKPFVTEELIAVVEKLQKVKQIKNRHDALIADQNITDTSSRLLGASPAFRRLIDMAGRVKGFDANVLIEGESGTGKELLARYIHAQEGDLTRPFIAVNCASIPENLIESELFGHEKGAFTGALYRRLGKFELANNGDIFLDEISTLKPSMQAKILRVLQEKEIVRIGSSATTKTNFRVIAATNEDLAMMVSRNIFRVDLYHRLRVVNLHIPPLRERRMDVPVLVGHFLFKYGRQNRYKEISTAAMELLRSYDWPGNIRELENIIHNLIIMSKNEVIEAGDLPDWIRRKPCGVDTTSINFDNMIPLRTLKEHRRSAEKECLVRALNTCNW